VKPVSVNALALCALQSHKVRILFYQYPITISTEKFVKSKTNSNPNLISRKTGFVCFCFAQGIHFSLMGSQAIMPITHLHDFETLQLGEKQLLCQMGYLRLNLPNI
jgi:hypothetical protein